jgi:hypothetical protein
MFKIFILEVRQGIQAYTLRIFLNYMSKCGIDHNWFFCKFYLTFNKGVHMDMSLYNLISSTKINIFNLIFHNELFFHHLLMNNEYVI